MQPTKNTPKGSLSRGAGTADQRMDFTNAKLTLIIASPKFHYMMHFGSLAPIMFFARQQNLSRSTENQAISNNQFLVDQTRFVLLHLGTSKASA